MSYRTGNVNRSNYQQEHTLIEDLDLVDANDYPTDKFIRKHHTPLVESGMNYINPEYNQAHAESYQQHAEQQHAEQQHAQRQHAQRQHAEQQYAEQHAQRQHAEQQHAERQHAERQHAEQQHAQQPVELYNQPYQLSCIEISEHCQNCPVCKKLYSADNTIYVIVIVILAIICILLLKKVLDV